MFSFFRFALDLVEVFFQIVHTRLPLLNPEQFRNSLRLHPSSTSAPGKDLHPALVATVISWGAKFSEHPLLVADRQNNNGHSLLAKTLIDRTRELAEALKVHRIPKDEHVVIGLLIEPLQSRKSTDQLIFIVTAQIFTAETPDDQTGIILVDGSGPGVFDSFPRILWLLAGISDSAPSRPRCTFFHVRDSDTRISLGSLD